MKKTIWIALIPEAVIFIAIALLMLCSNVQAQTLMLDKNNKIVEMPKAQTTAKKADPVHSIVKGVTYYQGPKGGVYCWKVSKKTGEKYKSYLPKNK